MNRLFIVLLSISFSSTVFADDDHLKATALVKAGSILPLEAIMKRVAIDYPGRILEVELEQKDDQYLYEIDLVDKRGLVWELKYDAMDGSLIEMERED